MPRLSLNQHPKTPEERLFARQIERMLIEHPVPLDGPTAFAEEIKSLADNLNLPISAIRSGSKVLIYRCLDTSKGTRFESDPMAIVYG
jgi:hypothetical protein